MQFTNVLVIFVWVVILKVTVKFCDNASRANLYTVAQNKMPRHTKLPKFQDLKVKDFLS